MYVIQRFGICDVSNVGYPVLADVNEFNEQSELLFAQILFLARDNRILILNNCLAIFVKNNSQLIVLIFSNKFINNRVRFFDKNFTAEIDCGYFFNIAFSGGSFLFMKPIPLFLGAPLAIGSVAGDSYIFKPGLFEQCTILRHRC